jgi:hypothetical protein
LTTIRTFKPSRYGRRTNEACELALAGSPFVFPRATALTWIFRAGLEADGIEKPSDW